MTETKEIRLADYTPAAFLVDSVHLDFDIQAKKTRVQSVLNVRRNPLAKTPNAPLTLDGKAQKLLAVKVNGRKLSAKDYLLTPESLTIPGLADTATVEIDSTNEPAKNTALSGLYIAGPILCTQCESDGFRRITYYPDRPDVMSKFSTTLHADKKKYPILLSNGNRIKSGNEPKGRHFVTWEDPFFKPCYLFALVAGKLDRVTDSFTTKSGRKVRLEIYTELGKKKETAFAMAALHKAMKWDEDTFGLEYDLDLFMIVAVGAFNYGAMENKGLNIFNDACALGRAETATDSAIAYIERVVGHEYFHNWTGDRITCRDWFQLSLKEGLTVFRDQEFCADMVSQDLERLDAAQDLRSRQFAEDAGAMAHPIRPSSYHAVDNFYTRTVYDKGAEVVRMIRTMVGRKGFRNGMNLYVKRHDGQAATCEDFVNAMADANGRDFKQYMLWYSQAGTPVLDVKGRYDAQKREYRLRVRQSCPPTPGQPDKKAMHIPLAVGLLDPVKGKDLIGTKVLELRKAQEEFVFADISQAPVPSLLRNFSAPVHLTYPYTDDELVFLVEHDSDAFNRWEAAQKLFMRCLLEAKPASQALLQALRVVLKDKRLDDGVKALILLPPVETEIGLALRSRGDLIDPVALYESRQARMREVATALADPLWSLYERLESTLNRKASDGPARSHRSLKNLCLAYLAKTAPEDALPLAAALVAESSNMTDKIAGLSILSDTASPLRAKMLALFDRSFRKEPLIMDRWLAIQAGAHRQGVLDDVKRLMKHPTFTLKNPNRVRALLASFAANTTGFHAIDGSGYRFIGEMAEVLDGLNPHMSASLAKTFLRWKDYDKKRQKLMLAELKRLSQNKALTVNCREVVLKSLKA